MAQNKLSNVPPSADMCLVQGSTLFFSGTVPDVGGPADLTGQTLSGTVFDQPFTVTIDADPTTGKFTAEVPPTLTTTVGQTGTWFLTRTDALLRPFIFAAGQAVVVAPGS